MQGCNLHIISLAPRWRRWRCQDRRLGPLSLSRQWNIGNPRSLHIPDSDRQSDAVAKAKGKDPNKRHHTNASSQLLSMITSISTPMHCIGSLFLRRRPAVVVLVILGWADKADTWRTHPACKLTNGNQAGDSPLDSWTRAFLDWEIPPLQLLLTQHF